MNINSLQKFNPFDVNKREKNKIYTNQIKLLNLHHYKRCGKYKKIIKFVYQDVPRGTGDAVLKCKNYIRSKYFLVLLPDDLIIKNNCSQSMIKLHNKYKSSIIASKRVRKKDVSRWGIFNLKKFIVINLKHTLINYFYLNHKFS